MGNARLAALKALEKCRRGGAWSDAVLGSVMDAEGLNGRDRGLATALCYGVMQNMAWLDHCINSYSSVKSGKLEPKVLDILRISAYQIIYLDRIPASAAVNEGVKLCRSLGYSRASGLVNAVLRRIAENAHNLPAVTGKTVAERLSLQYSHPLWLVDYFISILGEKETEELLRCHNSSVPVTVQVNTLKTTAEKLYSSLNESGIECKSHDLLPDCLVLSSSGAVAGLSQHDEGLFYVQDAAAKMAVLAASPQAGDAVLDCCAAPGGKSFAAGIISGGKAHITSCDIHENKLRRIRSGAERLGINSLETRAADARVFIPEWDSRFDCVIADVPCSGLGVIRKKPDIRYKDPAELAALPGIQLDILRNVSRYVKPGGTLLYSTCTVRKEENEAVICAFLSENSLFFAEDFILPREITSCRGVLQLWPQRHGTDGFFIAKLRRHK